MPGVNINYLAVLVCGIISMITGSLWYGPVLGKAWIKETGKTEEELMEGFNPVRAYLLAFLGQSVMALVLAYFLSLVSASTIVDGIRVSLASWAGFVGATMLVNSLFSRRSVKLFLIDGGYHFLNLLVFGIILVIWK